MTCVTYEKKVKEMGLFSLVEMERKRSDDI